MTALAWFVRSIPAAPELLQEVRALAGRVTDGLDKPGSADYVDHPWRALMAQKGLTPYSYTAHLKQSGVPQAPPPLPGHAPAWSYVPGGGPDAARAGSTEEQGGEDSFFSGIGTLTGPDGYGGGGVDGGGDDGGGQVSAPVANDDDHVRVGVVDDSVHGSGNVRTPAATDPLLDAGSTVGRAGADQSQVQAGAQVQGPAGSQSIRRKLCKSVWRDDVCRDRECDRAHPPRCGDPRCFPRRRSSCQHWHWMGGGQRQQQSQHQQQRQQPQHPQGNGSSAGPGRAGKRQPQGQQQRRPQQRRPQQQRPRQVQQGGQRQWRQLRQQQQSQLGQQQQQRQQQQQPSYRDVAARGTSFPPSGGNYGGASRGSPANVGFGPAPHDQATLSTVVAAVMAVLSGRGQLF